MLLLMPALLSGWLCLAGAGSSTSVDKPQLYSPNELWAESRVCAAYNRVRVSVYVSLQARQPTGGSSAQSTQTAVLVN